MSAATQSRREQITLLTPQKTGSLRIDAVYHNVPITALFAYVNALIAEILPDQAISPVYVLKYRRTMNDESGNANSLLFDLIDIRGGINPRSDSLFTAHPAAAELEKIRAVFINNKFFLSVYQNNEEYLPTPRIIELYNVRRVEGFQNNKTKNPDGPTSFFAWDTNVITESNELYRDLNRWNQRMHSFETNTFVTYGFEFLVDEDDHAGVVVDDAAPQKKRSPK